MRRWLRLAAHTTAVLAVIAAFLVVPMPVASFSPGGATPIDDLVVVEGGADQLDGELALLTVLVAQPSMFGTVRGWIDDRIDLVPREDVFPDNVRRVDFQAAQRENFRTTFRIAAGVGLRSAGLDVDIQTVARVAAVVDDGPAAGVLLPGDLVVAYEDQPVESAAQLVELASTATAGQVLDLVLQRAGSEIERQVVADVLPRSEQVGIGIAVETVEEELQLPVEVELSDQRSIGGPSAGLMVALTVYDLVAEEDLARGRFVAGTGTIDGQGRVGRVGGVHEKALAALDAGADLLLVPASQAGEARAAVGTSLEVIGVTSMEDALGALAATD